MSSHPKPVGKGGRKAIIFSSMFAKAGRRLWAYHNEEKLYFRTCATAREWAAKHGFDGVKFETPQGEWTGST